MNNQQIDKIVNFFRINFQLHQPYQLLLDGNFIKLVVEKELDLKKRLENALKAKVILRTTNCIMRELELLGEQFKLVLEQARQLKNIHCKHPIEQSADRCILEQVGNSNERQLFVCSQDLELRRRVRDLENVPIMYFGPDQRVTMEDIHKKTMQSLQQESKNKFLPQQKEMEEVAQLQKQQQQEEKKRKIRELSAQQGFKVRTKIAKGPNPLSVKKKKPKIQSQEPPVNPPKPKRKRIRKRNKKVEGSSEVFEQAC